MGEVCCLIGCVVWTMCGVREGCVCAVCVCRHAPRATPAHPLPSLLPLHSAILVRPKVVGPPKSFVEERPSDPDSDDDMELDIQNEKDRQTKPSPVSLPTHQSTASASAGSGRGSPNSVAHDAQMVGTLLQPILAVLGSNKKKDWSGLLASLEAPQAANWANSWFPYNKSGSAASKAYTLDATPSHVHAVLAQPCHLTP